MEKEHQVELNKQKALAEIEANKFKRIVDSIGSDTLAAIARAGYVLSLAVPCHGLVKHSE